MNQTIVEILIAGRARLEDPRHWTQEVYTRDNAGREVALSDPSATCFCVQGAIWAGNGYDRFQEAHNFLRAALPKDGGPLSSNHTWAFNDNPLTKHEDVLALSSKPAGCGRCFFVGRVFYPDAFCRSHGGNAPFSCTSEDTIYDGPLQSHAERPRPSYRVPHSARKRGGVLRHT